MSTADESSLARTPLGADLKAGIDALSYNQSVSFKKYVRKILPLDGYIFWVEGSLVSPPDADTKVVMGSFHYATDQVQEEAESYARNRVVFTAEAQIDGFNDLDPDTLYIAEYLGLTFAFSSRGNFYKQAEVWHYVGFAVYSDMSTQVIKTAGQLAALGPLITSNSLPVWLALNTLTPDWPFYPTLPLTFPLYPSFLVPQNITGKWGAVHIGVDDTNPIVSAPFFQPTLSQEQLCFDHVRITLWGLTNSEAMNFQAIVNQFSKDTDLIGIMNRPTLRDEKRTQSELGTIAQKKVIEYDVSFIQQNIVNFTQQLITNGNVSFFPQPLA